MNSFKNKKVIITGGSRGIGLSVLEALYKLQAEILTISSNPNNLENLKKKFPNIKIEQLNLKNQNDVVKQFPSLIDSLGGIDILINNAGITKDNLTLRMKEEEWKDVIDVNLNSVFFTCQAAIKPGDTQFALIFFLAYSFANDLVIATTPAFEAV